MLRSEKHVACYDESPYQVPCNNGNFQRLVEMLISLLLGQYSMKQRVLMQISQREYGKIQLQREGTNCHHQKALETAGNYQHCNLALDSTVMCNSAVYQHWIGGSLLGRLEQNIANGDVQNSWRRRCRSPEAARCLER